MVFMIFEKIRIAVSGGRASWEPCKPGGVHNWGSMDYDYPEGWTAAHPDIDENRLPGVVMSDVKK